MTGRLAALGDALGAGLVAAAGMALLAVRRVTRRAPGPARKRLVVINSFYSLDTVRARRAEHGITARDAGGYYEHVWSVHPFVDAGAQEAQTGPLTATSLAERHTVVEARVGRHPWLRRMPRLNFVLAQIALFRHLDQLVRREGVAVIQGDPYYHGLLAMALARVNRRVLEVRVWANIDAAHEELGSLAFPRLIPWRWLERRIARFTFSRADVVVTANEDNRRFAVANGARPDHTVQLGIWGMIDPINLLPPEERESPAIGAQDGPFALCVARLEPPKHPEDFVRAVAAARRTHPELRGVLAGEGSMREELTALIDELGLAGSLTLAGDRDHEWIAAALSAAAVIVVPLAGLALVEAALSGTPIVAYDVEWHSEVIRQGENGVLVPYRDVDALAAAVADVLERPDHAQAVAARARESILAIMAPDALAERERSHAARLVDLARSAA